MRKLMVLLIVMLIMSCKEKKDDSFLSKNILYDEVMAIHDKVMPEMSTIHALKRDLKSIENKESKAVIIKQIIELDEADEAMMSWMADFKVPEDKTKEEAYLKIEKHNIQVVSDKMYATMTQAKALLDSLKTVIN